MIKSIRGWYYRWRGYQAEKYIARRFKLKLAEKPNQPGWDVETPRSHKKFQVKTGISGVIEHLHRYPGIPVILLQQQKPSLIRRFVVRQLQTQGGIKWLV